jgi:serine/threonine protein kinase/Tol biopolymer transport system component
MIGETLAHFKITGKLGEGGMGEVYRAEDTKLGREVAIKVLPELFAQDAERMARFSREAQVLASLNHPNIAAIYQVEHDGDRHFLVMELVEGETLAERIKRGRLPLDEAMTIALQIAEALETAHDRGIVHRDLKPANINFTESGKIKVLDFGLAKALESGAGTDSDPSHPSLSLSPTLTAQMNTGAGVLLGTAAYMSPEQARGEAADRRADIWAFGVVVMEMLTGQTVYAGKTMSDTLAGILAREPEWEALPDDVPPVIRNLLDRCLQKEIGDRLQAIGEARIAIAGYLADPEAAKAQDATDSYSPLPTWRRLLPWGVAAVAVVGAATIALWPEDPVPPQPTTRASIPAPPGGEFNLGSDYPAPVAVSPDGRTLAFGIRGEDGVERLWIRDLDELESRPLTGTEGALYPFWSPDSRHIGFFAGGKLKKIEATGGPAMALCEASNGKGGSWNDAGTIVFAPSHNTPLHKVSAAGGESVALTEFDTKLGEDSHRHPRFLPDGDHFLFVARAGGGGAGSNSSIKIGSLAGEVSELMPATSNVEYAAGHLLYVFDQTLMARPFDAHTRELTGDAFPLAENIYVDMGALLGSFSVSDQGTLAYQMGSARESVLASLQWRSRSGEILSEIGAPDSYVEVHLSPVGKQAVVAKADFESGNTDLWQLDLDRELETRFTFETGTDYFVAWSPDGERIAFSSNRSGSFQLYSKSITGGGEEQLLREQEGTSYPSSWSPDGRYLVYQVNNGKSEDMFAWDVQGEGEPIPLQPTKFNDTVPMVSPDGRWLAWAGDDSGQWEIYVTPFPGGGRKWQISDGGDWPRWSRDGSEIFYLTAAGTLMATQVDGSDDTFQVGATETLFELGPFNDGFDYDVTADGQRFLVVKQAEQKEQQNQQPMALVLNWQNDLRRP